MILPVVSNVSSLYSGMNCLEYVSKEHIIFEAHDVYLARPHMD